MSHNETSFAAVNDKSGYATGVLNGASNGVYANGATNGIHEKPLKRARMSNGAADVACKLPRLNLETGGLSFP